MLVRRFVTIFPAALNDLSTQVDAAGTLNIWRATFTRTGNSILWFFQNSSGFSGSSGGFRGCDGAIEPLSRKFFRFFTAKANEKQVHTTSNASQNVFLPMITPLPKS